MQPVNQRLSGSRTNLTGVWYCSDRFTVNRTAPTPTWSTFFMFNLFTRKTRIRRRNGWTLHKICCLLDENRAKRSRVPDYQLCTELMEGEVRLKAFDIHEISPLTSKFSYFVPKCNTHNLFAVTFTWAYKRFRLHRKITGKFVTVYYWKKEMSASTLQPCCFLFVLGSS